MYSKLNKKHHKKALLNSFHLSDELDDFIWPRDSKLFPRPKRLISSPTCQRTLSLFAVSYRVVPGLQL